MNSANFIFRLPAVMFAATLSLLSPSLASENLDFWQSKMPITFSGCTPPGGGAPLTNFPALVVFSNNVAGTGFDYNDFLAPPYGDLRFADASTMAPLDFEVESWDTDGTSYVWVRVPELTSTTTIYTLWGRAGVEAPPCTTNGATWSSDFSAVWHMNESSPKDATGNGNNGTGEKWGSRGQWRHRRQYAVAEQCLFPLCELWNRP